ncbi:YgaP family membrane protein [Pelagibacterium limicola]|uniref:YgaP family membrane protein n=1 Tax=Pelagibacterium limicola TaxID=2791022 RepID=UPI0018AFAF09|nr:DUF2892 domain-containing protein [Pelagibacterium limicola]
MTANIGPYDRLIRAITGIALIAAAFFSRLPVFDNPALQWGAAILGAILILTALIRFCPLYLPLRLSTIKVRNQ